MFSIESLWSECMFRFVSSLWMGRSLIWEWISLGRMTFAKGGRIEEVLLAVYSLGLAVFCGLPAGISILFFLSLELILGWVLAGIVEAGDN